METTFPVAVGASLTDYHRFHVFRVLLLFIIRVLGSCYINHCSGSPEISMI